MDKLKNVAEDLGYAAIAITTLVGLGAIAIIPIAVALAVPASIAFLLFSAGHWLIGL